MGGPDIEQAGLEERGGAGFQEPQGNSELQTSLSSFKPKFDVQVPIFQWSHSHAVPDSCSMLEGNSGNESVASVECYCEVPVCVCVLCRMPWR